MQRLLTKTASFMGGAFIFWLCVHYGYFYFIDQIMNSKFMAFSQGYLFQEIGHYELVITFIESQIIFFVSSISLAIYTSYLIEKNIACIIKNSQNTLPKQQSIARVN